MHEYRQVLWWFVCFRNAKSCVAPAARMQLDYTSRIRYSNAILCRRTMSGKVAIYRLVLAVHALPQHRHRVLELLVRLQQREQFIVACSCVHSSAVCRMIVHAASFIWWRGYRWCDTRKHSYRTNAMLHVKSCAQEATVGNAGASSPTVQPPTRERVGESGVQ